jgi:undecaprenyl-diphosphatase
MWQDCRPMTWLDALLLGALEGLTEFLPISSTGHLILLSAWLGHEDDASKTLDIVIQLGAILAVVVYYRARLAALLGGIVRRDTASVRLALAIAIAFMPAALVGLALHSLIKEWLFKVVPVGLALMVGGVLMIVVERSLLRKRARAAVAEAASDEDPLARVTPKRALIIGLAQCLSLWPGASRSMTSILGGQLAGLSTAAAAEFSFLLAIPTLGAAAAFDLVKGGGALLARPGGTVALAVGLLVSFVVALLVIAAFLRYLRRFGLAPFGVYRIIVGALILLLPVSYR